MKIKNKLRYFFKILRQKTPLFRGAVKKLIWGTGKKNDHVNEIPKIIWLYWDEVNISSTTVKLCIHVIRELHHDYTINLIHKDNIQDYISDFPLALLKKPSNYVSDMARLMLLVKHGGIYLDATVLLSKKIDWAHRIQQEDKTEVVLYYTVENTTDAQFPMVETWFIAAPPQSKFLEDWLNEYRKYILSPNWETYYDNQDTLRADEFPLDPTYYISYFAGQVVMRKNQNYRLSLLRAEDDAFLYGLGFTKKWDEIAMAETLLVNKKPNPAPNLIKIIRFDRNRLDKYMKRGFYKKKSWLGNVLINYDANR